MNKAPEAQALINGMVEILKSVGIPIDKMTPRATEKMAMTMLAIADIYPGCTWKDAKGINEKHRVGTKDAIEFCNAHFGEKISRGSYDDVKRQDLLYPEQANIVIATGKNFQIVATNNPTRKYSLEENFAALVRFYKTPGWSAQLTEFLALQPSIKEQLNQSRGLIRVPVELPNGTSIIFEPGEHNQLQKAVIETFLPIYVPHCQVLYVGDAVNKKLYRRDEELLKLGFQSLDHEDLPDVIVYDPVRDCIFIIEAVHSFGAISEMRVLEIKRLMKDCNKSVVYVTAFLDKKAFQPWSSKIAWETEVWIATDPEHLIHYNGDKFLGPYKPGMQSSIRP